MRSSKIVPPLLTIIGVLISIYVATLALTITTSRETTSYGWMLHTQLVSRQIQETYAILIETEAAERDYLTMGDRSYLGPYDTLKRRVSQHIKILASLVRDNPEQLRNVAIFQACIERRLDLLDKKIIVRDKPDYKVSDLSPLMVKGRREMEMAKSISGRMLYVEDQLFAKRDKMATWHFSQLVIAMMLLILRDTFWCARQLRIETGNSGYLM